MLTVRERKKLPHPITVLPGDQLVCEITDKKTKQTFQHRENIGRTMVVDTIVTFDIENELDLADGIGGIFGKSAS